MLLVIPEQQATQVQPGMLARLEQLERPDRPERQDRPERWERPEVQAAQGRLVLQVALVPQDPQVQQVTDIIKNYVALFTFIYYTRSS